jgi:hypothetical protein
MTEYDEHISQLKDEIYGVKVLRDAQRDGSAHHDRFQQQINRLTDELFEWSDATPDLERLGAEIRAAKQRLFAARLEATNDLHFTGWASKGFGVLGIICLLISVTWTPSIWFPVLTFVFLALAVAAIMQGTRNRQALSEAVAVADSDLYSLQEQRRQRVPDRSATRAVARSIPAVGRLLVDPPELEDADVD